MADWLQLHITTRAEHAVELEEILLSLNALAITYQDEGNQPILEPDLGSMPLWQRIKLSALFNVDTDPTELTHQLHQVAPLHSISQLQTQQLADQDWERAWLVDFQPIDINQRLRILPSDWTDDALGANQLKLILDPGLAFGTGTHPTTYLCLHWLTEQNLAQKNVIDYGCGSGILAIAAALLGAQQVFAIDIDPQALTATRDNALKNGVSDRIITLLPEEWLARAQAVDVLVANILAGPLLALRPCFATYLKPRSPIALAGLLDTQADEIINAYQSHFELSAYQNQQEWTLLAGYRLSLAAGQNC